MNRLLIRALMLTLTAAPSLSLAATTAPTTASKPYYSVTASSIGSLLDNPATKAILEKVIPTVIDNPQIAMARPLTLKQLQKFAAGKITDMDLAKIDLEIAKIPPPKS